MIIFYLLLIALRVNYLQSTADRIAFYLQSTADDRIVFLLFAVYCW